MKKAKFYTIYILKKIKIFFLIYSVLIFIRRKLNHKKKILFKKKFQVIGKDNADIFLGYYDINNFSFDETKILFHYKLKNKKYTNISVLNLKNNKIIHYDFSYAWSWQLGSRSQWISSDEIIFNTIDKKGDLICKSINIKNNEFKHYPFSFFSISKNFKYAINLNFNLLEKFRPGYGYSFLQKGKNNDKNFISIWCIRTQKILHLFDQRLLKKKLKLPFSDIYFNHASWSPNSENFIIYAVKQKSRFNKLIYIKNFKEIKIINEIQLISHHEWISKNEIFFYGKIKNEKSFFVFNLDTNIHKKINFEFSNKDGHPHSSDHNLFIIDTYPNKFQERLLYTFDLKKKKFNLLGSAFNNFYLTNDKKCDFHPKLSKDNKTVLFDSTHNKRREFVILKI